jgi:hypothetical protein
MLSHRSGPKSLEALQRDAGQPEKGNEVHHVVEQTPAAREGHSQEDIDGPHNLARIPTLKHWEITGWYMTRIRTLGNFLLANISRERAGKRGGEFALMR